MRRLALAAIGSWLCVSRAWADPGPGGGLYITEQRCAATPDKGDCTSVGTICVTSEGGRTRGTVVRRSRAQIQHDVPPGVRFDVASASLAGTFTAAYPVRGARCKNLHDFAATATLGGAPTGGRYIELVVPAYRQLDVDTCALGARTSELKVRIFQVSDGTTCGGQGESPGPPEERAAPPEGAAHPKRAVELACASGPLEVLVDIVEGAQGSFYGLALTDRRDGSRTIVPERTLRLAQQETDPRADPPPLSWTSPEGHTHRLSATAFALAACRGQPPATSERQLVTFLEQTVRDFIAKKCKGARACERKLKIQASLGSRG